MSTDQEIRNQLNRIERCLLGDETIGHTGLVKVQKQHAQRISRLEQVGKYAAGGAFVISLAWTIWTQWPRK